MVTLHGAACRATPHLGRPKLLAKGTATMIGCVIERLQRESNYVPRSAQDTASYTSQSTAGPAAQRCRQTEEASQPKARQPPPAQHLVRDAKHLRRLGQAPNHLSRLAAPARHEQDGVESFPGLSPLHLSPRPVLDRRANSARLGRCTVSIDCAPIRSAMVRASLRMRAIALQWHSRTLRVLP